MMYGSPVLLGDNTIPGVKHPPALAEIIPRVTQACADFGIRPYPSVIELLTYDEISEVAAYSGFPRRYPHWSHGMQYEQLSKGYEYGMQKIYEMVINTNPSYIYCLDSNPMIDHVTVIAHALFHSDFFKNNVWFEPTNENAMNDLANHGTRIERYMDRWGQEEVVKFIDQVLCIDELIDLSHAWKKRHVKQISVADKRKYYYAKQLRLPETQGQSHDYMNTWINTKEYKEHQAQQIREKELRDQLNLFECKEKDILGFLVANAPLNNWQRDIISMLYQEAQYFAPQGLTKMLNEGWASYGDFNIMARGKWAESEGIVHYAKHKMGVLGGKYSMNPYAVGFKLFLYIEEKWNKGRFGRAYTECENAQEKANWDKKVGLGHQKVFEVREVHNDVTAIQEFIDQEFCDKYEFFVWKKFPRQDGGVDYRIQSRDVKDVKKMLIERYINGGRPDIRLVDPNFAGKRIFMLEHQWDGRPLHPSNTRRTMVPLWRLWNNFGMASKSPVALSTRDKNDNEVVYVCNSNDDEKVVMMTRKQFESEFA